MAHAHGRRRLALLVGLSVAAVAAAAVVVLSSCELGPAPLDKMADPSDLALEPPSPTDWPQWRGRDQTGLAAETAWTTDWPDDGPTVLWTASVGTGYSAVAVSRGRVYTMGNINGHDVVFSLDADTGKVVWQRAYRCPAGSYKGPRATPTVHGDAVYTISRQGNLYCFRADSGEILWHKDVPAEVRATVPGWGIAGSPLVEGNLVIVNVGTAGVALDKATGDVVWSTGDAKSGYATPLAFTLGGQRRVAIFAARAIVVLDPADGSVVWQHSWKTYEDINAATPIVTKGRVFISSDYDVGAALLRIGADDPVVWQNKAMNNHFSTCVLWQDHLYGFDGHASRRTPLVCLDVETGKEKWRYRGPREGGSLVVADGKIIALTGKGILLVAEASPEAYKELARAKVLRGLCWTVPVLSGARIYCRNHKGDLVCLDVSGN